MRHLVAWSIFAAVVFGVGQRANAGDDAAAIIKQHLDSRGGNDRIAGLLGYQLRGTISQGGRTQPLHLWWKRPGKLRIETGNGASSTVSAYDGTTAWTVEPGPWGRQASGMMPGLREMFIKLSDWEGPFINTEKKGLRLKADSEIWGDRGYLFKVQQASGTEDQVLLNAGMRLVAKEVYEVGPPGYEHKVERRYSTFRRVEGFAVPFRIEQFVDGGGSLDATIEVIEFIVGPAIPDSLFGMPNTSYPKTDDPTLIEVENLTSLRDHFAADAGRVRLVAILSPTSAESHQELLDLKAVMDSTKDDRLAALVVWSPILESDNKASATARKKEADDPRITFLWDPKLVAAQNLRDALQLKSNALNLCCVYGPDAQWDSTPGSPEYWTQPGRGDHGDSELDGTQNIGKIREMLSKMPQDKKKHAAKTSQH